MAANEDRGDNLTASNEDESKIAADKAAADAAAAAEKEAADKAAAEAADKEAAEKEAAAKAAADEERARDEKGRFIPVSRHKDVLEKERERADIAERKLAELNDQLKQVDRNADVQKLETEITELEKAHAKALLDGDVDKAAEHMRAIRLKERTIAIQESDRLSSRAKDQAREEVRLDMAIERLEAAYPQLNEKSDEFDQTLTELVLSSQRTYIERDRMAPADALVKAAATVMEKFKTALPAAAADEKGLQAAKDAAKERTEAQVKANLDAAAKTPAALKDAGKDSDKGGLTEKVDVKKLTDEEFRALPDATKARLRGDLL